MVSATTWALQNKLLDYSYYLEAIKKYDFNNNLRFLRLYNIFTGQLTIFMKYASILFIKKRV